MNEHINKEKVAGLPGVKALVTFAMLIASGFALLAVTAGPMTAAALAAPQVQTRGDGKLSTAPSPASTTTPTTVPTMAPTPTLTPTSTPGTNPCSPAWAIVPSPNPQSTHGKDAKLSGVAAVSPNDIWAVGTYIPGLESPRFLVEHWDGIEWSVVPTDLSAGGGLFEVAAVSTNDVWAVGYSYLDWRTFIAHWDGARWTRIPSPSPGYASSLSGVDAISANDVWAVGNQTTYDGFAKTLIEHWDGSQWSVVPSPDQGTFSSSLASAAAVSPTDVWAVGSRNSPDDLIYEMLIEHWDGSQWSVVPSPNLGTSNSALSAVSLVSANDVWAVGASWGTGDPPERLTVTLHWDGSAWRIVPSPSPSSYSVLAAVSGVAANDVWAVGTYGPTSTIQPPRYMLMMHWDGSNWNVVPSPSPSTTSNGLSGVAALATDDVWAVGSYMPDQNTRTLATWYTNRMQYSDVLPSSTFHTYITCLACRGIISGYPDGTFGPGNPVTRGQLSKIVSNSAGYTETYSTNTFEDVPAGSTFFAYIERLYAHGGISGYPCGAVEPCIPPANKPYFRPGANVTRGQTSKIVAIAKGLPAPPSGQQTFEGVAPGSTFWQWIEPLAATGAIGGYPCGGAGEPCIPPTNRPYFRPGANVTRGQSAKIVANTFFPNCSTPAVSK